MRTRSSTGPFVKAIGVLAALSLATCGGSTTTMFPAGLQPWEMTNQAPAPTPVGTDMFPESITFVDLMWMDPTTMVNTNSVHARAFVHMPITAVWVAARDPQTGRDPTQSQGFSVLAWADDPTYEWSYRTHVIVNNLVTLEWDVEWRHGVVSGTDAAPTVTATRWQKTNGDSRIQVIEGSLVLRTVDGQPNVTAVEYQYHLAAPFSDHNTIHDYLTVIYGRLRDRAHGTPLNPNDCTNCPPPPPGYGP
jgi:hypothetical protein